MKMVFQFIALILGVTLISAQEGPAELFQAALHEEEVVGDLERAISLYEKAADSSQDRHLMAQALFRVGVCREKLGQERAEAAFQRILDEFPDQQRIAVKAKERLTELKLDLKSDSVSAHCLLSPPQLKKYNFGIMAVNPDGRRIAYISFPDGSLWTLDLKSNERTQLTKGTTENRWASYPVWSPDGAELIYRSQDTTTQTTTLRRIVLASMKRSIVPATAGLELVPLEMFPEGRKLLLTERHTEDQGNSIAILVLDSGELDHVLTRPQTGRLGAPDLSPDGEHIVYSSSNDENIYVVMTDDASPKQVTQDPGAERVPMWSPDGTALAYQRKEGMWILPVAENGMPAGQPQLIRSEPLDRPLAWIDSGLYYVQRNMLIRAFAVPVDPVTGQSRGPAQSLAPQLEEARRMDWSPDMRYFAVASTSEISVEDLEESSIRSFSCREFGTPSHLWWSSSPERIYFVPYPAKGRGSTICVLNFEEEEIKRLFPNQFNLSRLHLSPDGEQMLFLRGRTDTPRELVVAPAGEFEGEVLATDESDAGKIASWIRPRFSPSGSRILFGRVRPVEGPEEGRIVSLWIIGTDGSTPEQVASKKVGPGPKPYVWSSVWHPSGSYIAYDYGMSVYVVDLQLHKEHEIAVPAKGANILRVRSWSPDGKQIAIHKAQSSPELWVLRNLMNQATNPVQTNR